jgi:molybdopterin synthase catalytic subunit
MIQITDQPIDCEAVLKTVYDADCGANLLFTGTTRRMTGEQETKFLVYQCYQEMAIKEMESLAAAAKTKWPIKQVAVVHRTGKVEIGEASIAIAVSGPHRKETFAAGEWLIDELKKKVPIWKQENGVDGNQQWVHPNAEAKGVETP